MVTQAPYLIERDDPAACRFWDVLIAMTSGFAARAGVPAPDRATPPPPGPVPVPPPRTGSSWERVPRTARSRHGSRGSREAARADGRGTPRRDGNGAPRGDGWQR